MVKDHSPLPWNNPHGTLELYSADGQFVGLALREGFPMLASDRTSPRVDKAFGNIRFIEDACNCHYLFIKALRMYQAMIDKEVPGEEALKILRDTGWDGKEDAVGFMVKYSKNILDALEGI